jgi:Ca2+:H+ antiporter
MRPLLKWHSALPVLALLALAAAWGRYELPVIVSLLIGVLLGGAVLSAVHHAEVIAHKVGEPFGSLVLAVAVTVIEVGLIVMLMSAGGSEAHTLARDTVFAAVMITANGIVGASLIASTARGTLARFNAEGSASAMCTVLVLTVMTLVLPTFTESAPQGEFSASQLVFAAIVSLALWGSFVVTQTVRHRDFFLPVDAKGRPAKPDEHAEPPTRREALTSLVLLLVSLAAVVGLAKTESPAIEDAVAGAGLPQAFVGVVIALVVLLPESLAAIRNARRDRTQVSLNLAYGSAMASIGLTVPVIAVLSLVFDLPLVLGLEPVHLVLLGLTVAASAFTLLPGRATRLDGVLHLAVFAGFIFLSAVP